MKLKLVFLSFSLFQLFAFNKVQANLDDGINAARKAHTGVLAAGARATGALSLATDPTQCKDNPEMVMRALAGYYQSYAPKVLGAAALKKCFNRFLATADDYQDQPNSKTAAFDKKFAGAGLSFLKKAIEFVDNPPSAKKNKAASQLNKYIKTVLADTVPFNDKTGHYELLDDKALEIYLKRNIYDAKTCDTTILNIDKLARVDFVEPGKGAVLLPVKKTASDRFSTLIFGIDSTKPVLWLSEEQAKEAAPGDFYQVTKKLTKHYDGKTMVMAHKVSLGDACKVIWS